MLLTWQRNAKPGHAARDPAGLAPQRRPAVVFLGSASEFTLTVGLSGYFDFVTNMMLLFGVGFEFPLIVVMLNFAGILSIKGGGAGSLDSRVCQQITPVDSI